MRNEISNFEFSRGPTERATTEGESISRGNFEFSRGPTERATTDGESISRGNFEFSRGTGDGETISRGTFDKPTSDVRPTFMNTGKKANFVTLEKTEQEVSDD